MRFTRTCTCGNCTAMYDLADKIYRQLVADRVPYCIAVNAAAVVMALAASNDRAEAENVLEDACDFAREYLPNIPAVH
jgi:hypothetical protein